MTVNLKQTVFKLISLPFRALNEEPALYSSAQLQPKGTNYSVLYSMPWQI